MSYQPRPMIDAQAQALSAELCTWVNINTGSTHLAGLQSFARLLAARLRPLADTLTCIDLPAYHTVDAQGEWQSCSVGPAILACKRPQAPLQIYLGGHYDTVFPQDSVFQRASWLAGDKLGGPGVLDMKSGLLIMLTALAAFEHSPLAHLLGWRVLINPDEEIGSPASAALIDTTTQGCQWGLLYEPALDVSGAMARARGGSRKYALVVRGRSAHVGRQFHEGRNAIVKCAQYIHALASLNQMFPSCAVNIGKMHGGEAVNQVPALAVAYIDVRAPLQSDLIAMDEAISKVVVNDDGDYSVSCHLLGKREPKVMDAVQTQLVDFSQAYLASVGIDLHWRDTGGCSDGNLLSALGLANIDTLGGCGGAIHTDQEWLAVPSLTERALLSAWLLHGLAEQALMQAR